MITDNNPSKIFMLIIIVFIGIVVYEIISVVLLKRRKEKLGKVMGMIKERHTKIENYKIMKERENVSLKEDSAVNDFDVWDY